MDDDGGGSDSFLENHRTHYPSLNFDMDLSPQEKKLFWDNYFTLNPHSFEIMNGHPFIMIMTL
jgi:hypothetical protein